MAKLLHAVTGEVAPQEIVSRWKNGNNTPMTNSVIAGEREIFFRQKWKHYYMPYEELIWAYRQVAESHVTLGCCGGVIQEFRVIMRPKQGEDAKVWFDRETEAVQLMDIIQQRNPDCAIGFTDENKKRFGIKKR